MEFLDFDLLKKKADEVSVTPHVMFSHVPEVSSAECKSYFMGCVLAALLDDGEISKEENDKLRKLGLSLKLSNDEIRECEKTVKELREEEKSGFLDDLVADMSRDIISFFFLSDMANILPLEANPDYKKYWLYFGKMLYKTDDWQRRYATIATKMENAGMDGMGNVVIKFELAEGVELELVKVSAGEFTMGCNDFDNAKKHKVKITKDFYIGKFAVTQAQYLAIEGNNPSSSKDANSPVENVSYNDVIRFISRLNRKFRNNVPDGYEFNLPTEAQWEFAARGGTKTKGCKYSGSNSIDKVAWYSDNSDGKSHQVGLLDSNELGIYDMSGNVWEWCLDWWGGYSEQDVTDPVGLSFGSSRVRRGGSWDGVPGYCQVAFRSSYNPASRLNILGFRLVLSVT